jgi:hypothetical protein
MPLRDRLAARRAAKTGGAPQQLAPPEPAQASAPAPDPAPAPPASAPAPAPAASPGEDQMEELKQLGELHEQGVLTDEEFETQKTKILNSLSS